MFLFLYVYISTIYLFIIYVYRLVVIVTLHLGRRARQPTFRLRRSPSLFDYTSSLCDPNRSR